MEGRHVHPSTLYPGGVGTVATIQLMTDYITRLMRYVEFMKKVVPMHDDLFDFFYEALPGYEQVGLRRTLLGCWGSLPGPGVLQLRLQGHDRVGPEDVRHPRRRGGRQAGHHRPGATSTWASGSCSAPRTTTTGTDQEMFVTHDPLGNPVDRRHPWNQHTNPRPQKRDLDDKYSWVMSPRWFDGKDHLALDTGGGPLARLWATALAGLVDIGYVKSTGHSVQINLPKTALKGPVDFRVEDPAVEQHAGTQPGPHLLPGLRGGLRAPLRGEGARGDPGRAHQDLGDVRGPGGRHRLRVHRGGPRRAVATTW